MLKTRPYLEARSNMAFIALNVWVYITTVKFMADKKDENEVRAPLKAEVFRPTSNQKGGSGSACQSERKRERIASGENMLNQPKMLIIIST